MSEEKEEKLTPKEQKFVECYLGEAHFNATQAAALAGYKGNRNVLGVMAYRLLRKAKIKAEIDEVLSAMTMPANVVLERLTEIANGKVTDFYKDGRFDLDAATERKKDHLLKKVKQKRTIRQKKTEIRDDMRLFLAEDEIEDVESEVEIIYEETEFEIYSSHEALRDLGKHHKLFTDRIESENKNENVNLTLDEFNKRAVDRLAATTEAVKKRNE